MRRILVVSDLHCGHRAGLTPPPWQYVVTPDEPERSRWGRYQRECWETYCRMVERVGAVDVLIVNGDAVDGHGSRSGGVELITVDMNEQAHMAAVCLSQIKAREVLMIYGTPYHTGMAEDYEDLVAAEIGAPRPRQAETIVVEGVHINIRHFVSSSIVPYGRHTAISRDKLWSWIWADMYRNQKPDIVIRSHVHYAALSYDTPLGYGIITPALQGLGGRYGSRRCPGWVDFGITLIEVDGRDSIRPMFLHATVTADKIAPRVIGE